MSKKKKDKSEKSDSKNQKGVEAANTQDGGDKNENPELNNSADRCQNHSSPFQSEADGIKKVAGLGMLRRSSNLNIINEGACAKTFYVVAWIIGWLVCFHCGVKYTILKIGEDSAKAKFFIMAQQVKNYMNQQRYPDRIKKKILYFYAVRFQSIFCSELKMITCMSGQLHEDIIIHISRQLVSQVDFLKKLPRNRLLTIGTKMKIQLFLSGDIIYKINTIADCLYFIDKGTVAIYCESGMEFCHLQDGDYFGEIGLVPPLRFRVASAVAVTNCELFRLDKKDFGATIACVPTVYEEMKKGALHRHGLLIVVDWHHKAEM